MSVRRFLNYFNYNVYLASVFSLLRLRYQTKASSLKLRKLSPFVGAAIPAIPFVKRLKIGAWSPFTTKEEEEAEALGIKVRNRKDVALLKDLIAADKLYEIRDYREHEKIYELLNKHKDSGEPEVLWRLARIMYELALLKQQMPKTKDTLDEALAIVEKALELDEENFASHKWMAIILNQVSTMKSFKEQILQAENFRKHMTRATELNPKDATSIHLLGRWCYSVADVPYWQRKAAATFIATPPTCDFSEALDFFLTAEHVKPKFYSMNLLMIAKCYIQMGNLDEAFYSLIRLENYKGLSKEDIDAKEEGKRLWKAHKTFFFMKQVEQADSGQTRDIKWPPKPIWQRLKEEKAEKEASSKSKV